MEICTSKKLSGTLPKRLSDSNVYPRNLLKMKVSLAALVMSSSVLIAIGILMELDPFIYKSNWLSQQLKVTLITLTFENLHYTI